MTALFICYLLFSGETLKAAGIETVYEPRPLTGTGIDTPDKAAIIFLEELEPFVVEAPETLIALAKLEETLYRLDREQAVSGLRIHGAAGTGLFREAVNEDRMRGYNQVRVSLGLHYPLLGTLVSEQINVLKAEGETWASRQKVHIARLKSLAALRLQYILLWGSQQKLKLSNAFLANEYKVDTVLQKRKEAGLLLESDRLEFMTTFFLVRRDAANLAVTGKRALKNINMLTNECVDIFTASFPSLPFPLLDKEALRSAVVDRHPEIIMLRGLIEKQLSVINLARNTDIQAYMSMTGHGELDYPSLQKNYGILLQFNMDLPWEFSRAGRAQENAEQALLRKLQHELDKISTQLLIRTEYYLQRYYAALENKRFAAQRVKSALVAVRERTLRQWYLPGDVFEQLQSSLYFYYRTAMDYIDAEVIELQSIVRLLALHEEGKRTQKAGIQFDSVINKNFLKPLWSQEGFGQEDKILFRSHEKGRNKMQKQEHGVYAWNTRKLFDQVRSGEVFWKQLADNNITTILLSFDGKQLDELATPAGENHLRSFIQDAKDRDIITGLLLGEPTWILPEYRGRLLKIIEEVQVMGFDLIHLDLEPNQLEYTKLPIEYLLAHLLRTVQAVTHITPLPVEISLHPRYLNADANNFCLGCGLKNLDGVNVTLMVYVTNPRRVAEIIQPILEEFPEITFSIAQSVEPHLTSEESHALGSKAAFHDVLAELNNLTNNMLQSIYIQSWQDYMGMHDEN